MASNTQRKVAVITGASQGIGAGLVRGFLDRGYRVVANSRSIEPASTEDVLAIAGDIAEPQVAEKVIKGAVEKFGRVDTLVNNAGVFVAKPSRSTPRPITTTFSASTWLASSTSRSMLSGRCSHRVAAISSTSRQRS